MHLHLPTTLLPLLFGLVKATQTIVSTITESAAPQPTSSSYTSDQQFQNDLLKATNFYRGEHGVGAVTWNTTSATFAANWAKGCAFKHSGGPTGENLAAGYANASAAVDGWGLERQKYNFNKPGFSETTGHFTQLVWSNTTSIGCARVNCAGKNGTPGFYVVCEYFPAGNIVGNNNRYFKDNVKKQVQGKSSDTVESGVNGKGGSVTTSSTPTGSTPTATAKSSASKTMVVGTSGSKGRLYIATGMGTVAIVVFGVIW